MVVVSWRRSCCVLKKQDILASTLNHNSNQLSTKNKMAIRRKQVCLFGTSADPPTGQGGHLGIAQHLVSMDFDEVRILPVYSHMFGVSKNITY